MPPIGHEALRRVVGEPALGLSVDRYSVVVVEHDQLAEAEGARQRTRLVRDAFHQATVADEHVGVMIDDVVTGAVEFGGEQRFSERHPDCIRESLSQRPGSCLDAGCQTALGMSRRLREQLAKALDLVDRQVVAAEV